MTGGVADELSVDHDEFKSQYQKKKEEKKAEARTMIWSSDTAPGYIPKRNVSQDTIETPIFRCSSQHYLQ
jgi:hypothetical protein